MSVKNYQGIISEILKDANKCKIESEKDFEGAIASIIEGIKTHKKDHQF